MEDKALFENSFEITEEMYVYFFCNPIGESAAKRNLKYNILYSVFTLILIACIVYLFITAKYYIAIVAAVLLAAYIYRLFFNRKVISRRFFRRTLKEFGAEKWIRKTCFYSDRLVLSEFITDTAVKYSDIMKVTSDKGFYYFWRNKDQILRVAKNGFSEDALSSFELFIKENIEK